MRADASRQRVMVVLLSVTLAALAACATTGRWAETVLRLSGSDSMLPLTRLLARAFETEQPGVRVRVAGGGSTAGIAALIEGHVDICASSRPLTAAEAQRLYQRHGRLGVRVQVGRDALEVFVHPDNPVRSLTMPQLKGIFTGRIRRWEKVGGREGSIEVLIRPETSGTHGFFRAVALHGEEYAPHATVIDTTAELLALVGADASAIGYGAMAYAMQGDVVAISLDGVPPTPEAVRSGAYPLSRYLYLVTPGPPRGLAKRLVDFALSPAGQRLVAEAGFIPIYEQ